MKNNSNLKNLNSMDKIKLIRQALKEATSPVMNLLTSKGIPTKDAELTLSVFYVMLYVKLTGNVYFTYMLEGDEEEFDFSSARGNEGTIKGVAELSELVKLLPEIKKILAPIAIDYKATFDEDMRRSEMLS